MTISFEKKINNKLEEISEFKSSVSKASANLLELETRRSNTYNLILKDLNDPKKFKDMIFKDSEGHVKEFRNVVTLELRYLERLRRAFAKFEISLKNLLHSAPDKFDNHVLEAADAIYDDLMSTIANNMNKLKERLLSQLRLTQFSRTESFFLSMNIFVKKERFFMIDKFMMFIEDVNKENELRIKVREEIQEKRRMLEKLMPEITKTVKNKNKEIIDIVRKYVDDADDTFETSQTSFRTSLSSSRNFGSYGGSSFKVGSGSSFRGGGGGSFGGGGAGGSW